MSALIANNVLNLANKERVDYLRNLVPRRRLKYLSRRAGTVRAASVGGGVKLEVLAPERDAGVYYKSRDTRLWLDMAARFGSLGNVRRPRAELARHPLARQRRVGRQGEALGHAETPLHATSPT